MWPQRTATVSLSSHIFFSVCAPVVKHSEFWGVLCTHSNAHASAPVLAHSLTWLAYTRFLSFSVFVWSATLLEYQAGMRLFVSENSKCVCVCVCVALTWHNWCKRINIETGHYFIYSDKIDDDDLWHRARSLFFVTHQRQQHSAWHFSLIGGLNDFQVL